METPPPPDPRAPVRAALAALDGKVTQDAIAKLAWPGAKSPATQLTRYLNTTGNKASSRDIRSTSYVQLLVMLDRLLALHGIKID